MSQGKWADREAQRLHNTALAHIPGRRWNRMGMNGNTGKTKRARRLEPLGMLAGDTYYHDPKGEQVYRQNAGSIKALPVTDIAQFDIDVAALRRALQRVFK